MKILHLLQSDRFSGAENVVCQIINMFRDDKNIEMVYCSRDGQIRKALEERCITFVPIKDLTVKEVKRVLREQNPDIIHAHDRLASYIASKIDERIPIVVHMHVNNNNGIITFLKNILWLSRSKYFKHIFWVSQSSFRGFQFHFLLRNKSSILYNVVEPNEVKKKAQSDLNTYNYDIVYVGRLSYQKNPKRLLRVLKNICDINPKLKVAIVGTGDYKEYVVQYIEAHNLKNRIEYLGFMDNPLKIIESAKIFLMTSRFEGTPMVAIEAQILGVPIISTPVDGMKDVIDSGENGFLEKNDADIQSRAIQLISNEDFRDKMRASSISKSLVFTNIDNYKNTLAFYYNNIIQG